MSVLRPCLETETRTERGRKWGRGGQAFSLLTNTPAAEDKPTSPVSAKIPDTTEEQFRQFSQCGASTLLCSVSWRSPSKQASSMLGPDRPITLWVQNKISFQARLRVIIAEIKFCLFFLCLFLLSLSFLWFYFLPYFSVFRPVFQNCNFIFCYP